MITDRQTGRQETLTEELLDGRILVDRQPPLATVTINRPGQRNALSFDMWRAMAGLLRDLDADREIRAVVIAGAGGEAFSAGADIADFEAHRSDSVKGRGYNDAVDGLLKAAAGMATPTIAMVQGFAAGGGCELAVATDLRLAGEGSAYKSSYRNVDSFEAPSPTTFVINMKIIGINVKR